MKWNIELTWSKMVAVLVLGCAVYLDIKVKGNGTFMFAVPFVVFLITGKQYLDGKNKQ
jgi:hypothetical protein